MGGAGCRAPTACGVSPSVNMATNYEAHAEGFWEGTKDHDVTQNYAAFLDFAQKTGASPALDAGGLPQA
jgi:hypothetical protein